jgi:hypothetical protein
LNAEEEQEKVKVELEKERLWHEIERIRATSDIELQALDIPSGSRGLDIGQGIIEIGHKRQNNDPNL